MTSNPLTNRRRKEIASLRFRKYREQLAEMLVEGKRSVTSAIDAEAPIREIVVAESVANGPGILPITERAKVPVYVVSDEEIDAMSAVETSQGILAVVAIETRSPTELRSARRILVLEGLQDPGNVGTVIRTAAWFGVDAVATAPGTADVYNPKVVRAAMGALWDLKHVYVNDLVGVLDDLRRTGYAVYGADLTGTAVGAWRPAARSVLVLGSESHGISREVDGLLDERIVVPGVASRQGTESLNAAVAAGILMYAWLA